MSPPFVGVDGCRGGWIAAAWDGEAAGAGATAEVLPAFAEVLARFPDATVAADVPVGLLDAPAPEGRACDRAARALLGPRARSVFSPPARADLRAAGFGETRGISLQAWHLLPKIREVDTAMTPERQARVVEAHPELAFARMAGAPMRHPKRAAEGKIERRRALRRAGLAPPPRPAGAAEDDLLDACALAWTARRVATGGALRVPDAPPRDARGLRMEIWA